MYIHGKKRNYHFNKWNSKNLKERFEIFEDTVQQTTSKMCHLLESKETENSDIVNQITTTKSAQT